MLQRAVQQEDVAEGELVGIKPVLGGRRKGRGQRQKEYQFLHNGLYSKFSSSAPPLRR